MRDMEDLLQQYMANNRMFHFEGERGVRELEQVMKEVCGYKSDWGGVLHNFFADNPGAIEAVLDWVSSQNNTEWHENLEQMVEPEDEDSEEDDDAATSDDATDDRDFVVRGYK